MRLGVAVERSPVGPAGRRRGDPLVLLQLSFPEWHGLMRCAWTSWATQFLANRNTRRPRPDYRVGVTLLDVVKRLDELQPQRARA